MSKMRIEVNGDVEDQVEIMVDNVHERVTEYGFRGRRVLSAGRSRVDRDAERGGYSGRVTCVIEDGT